LGTAFGLVYRRWSLVGLVAFVAAQITVLLILAGGPVARCLLTYWSDSRGEGGGRLVD